MQVILLFVFICITAGDPIIKRERVGFLLTGLTLPHLCACTYPESGFLTLYVVDFSKKYLRSSVKMRGDCWFC